jgi:hypothetical protein
MLEVGTHPKSRTMLTSIVVLILTIDHSRGVQMELIFINFFFVVSLHQFLMLN